jgi:hypothetical protein
LPSYRSWLYNVYVVNSHIAALATVSFQSAMNYLDPDHFSRVYFYR